MMQLEQAKTRSTTTNKGDLTRKRKRALLNKKCKGCNNCHKPRELEYMIQLPMTMKSVIRSHRTIGTSLIIVVRIHSFKTDAQLLSTLAQMFVDMVVCHVVTWLCVTW